MGLIGLTKSTGGPSVAQRRKPITPLHAKEKITYNQQV